MLPEEAHILRKRRDKGLSRQWHKNTFQKCSMKQTGKKNLGEATVLDWREKLSPWGNPGDYHHTASQLSAAVHQLTQIQVIAYIPISIIDN